MRVLDYVRQNNIEKVKELLALGYSVHESSMYGSLPLNDACYNGNEEMVKLLIDAGADIDQRCRTPQPPLGLAIQLGHVNIVKLLINAGCNINYEAPANETETIFQLLIAAGLDINHKYGGTPLTKALNAKRYDIAKLLINAGCNTDLIGAFDPEKSILLAKKIKLEKGISILDKHIKDIDDGQIKFKTLVDNVINDLPIDEDDEQPYQVSSYICADNYLNLDDRCVNESQ